MAHTYIPIIPPRPSARALALLVGGALFLARPAWARPPFSLDVSTPAGELEAEAPFPVPDALRSAVRFWYGIFTRHPSDRLVVHDREDMDVIWRVIELPKDDQGRADEPAIDKMALAAVEDLRGRLTRLSARASPLDEEDRILLTLAGDPARLQGAAQRLRSQRGVADHFRAGLARSRPWMEAIRQVLAEEGVPVEIAALPFIESMFNTSARSYVGAAGIWQLMPATARGLGLKVSRQRDERLDVLKATRAAARMLRQNYRMLGSWPLAITAYNHGPYGVRRAVQAVGSTDLMVLIEQYEKSTWGFASKNFYAEFIAALAVVADAEATESNTVSSIRD